MDIDRVLEGRLVPVELQHNGLLPSVSLLRKAKVWLLHEMTSTDRIATNPPFEKSLEKKLCSLVCKDLAGRKGTNRLQKSGPSAIRYIRSPLP